MVTPWKLTKEKKEKNLPKNFTNKKKKKMKEGSGRKTQTFSLVAQ